MATTQVTTTLLVQFTPASGSGGSLSAQLDDRANGLNAGKSSFQPGDPAAFLIFMTDDVTLDSVVTSLPGGLTQLGSGVYSVTETLQFANTDTASLSKPYHGGLTINWFGNDLGSLTPSGTSVKAATSGIGVCEVTYNSQYVAYQLSSPATLGGATTYSILIVVTGHSG